MSNIITPTVGRKVWFRCNDAAAFEKPRTGTEAAPLSRPQIIDNEQPLDATVVYVWNDRLVNLQVLDHYGNPFIASSVTLLQDGDETPSFGSYAEWMPYQLGQAKKADAANTPAPAVETVTYADGTEATGTAPLPADSPAADAQATPTPASEVSVAAPQPAAVQAAVVAEA